MIQIFIPQKGSVVAPFNFELFVYGPAKERKIETVSYISLHLSKLR